MTADRWTREQFVDAYGEKPGDDAASRRAFERGSVAIECECDYEQCHGWQFQRTEDMPTWIPPDRLAAALAYRDEWLAAHPPTPPTTESETP
jgi:hypothetical protein